MKKTSFNYLIVLVLLTAATGCSKDSDPSPSEPHLSFQFPQGNNSYDERIIEFNKRYGKYILYKFGEIEFRYNITSYILFVGENAEEGFVNQALDSLQSHLFGYYDEELLKTLMPQKFFLSSLVRKVKANNANIVEIFPTPIHSVQAINHVTFGHAGSSLLSLSSANWDTVRGDLHFNLWLNCLTAGKLKVPPAFYTGIDYTKVTAGNYKTFGIIEYDVSNKPNDVKDFATYVKYITSRSKEELDNGLLSPATDPQSKYRNRYNFIINYFQSEFGIDLQAIGNKP